jgi:hypothetical protein
MFGRLTEIKLNQAITLLAPTCVHVKELIIRNGALSKFDVVRIVKLFPNLNKLSLLSLYSAQNSGHELQGSGVISLPKLTDITIRSCYNESEDLLMDFRDCSITDFNICLTGTRFNKNIVAFIKTQEKSLKRWHLDPFNSDIRTFMGDFKEMRLEELFLSYYRGDHAVLLDFLRQSQSTLKSLSLNYCDLTNEMLEGICESLINLEELHLHRRGFNDLSSGLLALQKLKKLRKFIADLNINVNVFKGFTVAVNDNMLEIEAPLGYASTEFIAQLDTCLPNLRKLSTRPVSAVQVKTILVNFKKLQDFTIHVPGISKRDSKKILRIINDNGNKLTRLKHT